MDPPTLIKRILAKVGVFKKVGLIETRALTEVRAGKIHCLRAHFTWSSKEEGPAQLAW